MPRGRKMLSEQKGNLTVEQQNRKAQEEAMAKMDNSRLDKPPSFLNGIIAVDEWNNVVTELKGNTLISNLDIGALVVYCNAFADYVEVTKKCQSEPKIIPGVDRSGNPAPKVNPWITLQQRYSDEMRKSAAKCGIDINSRLKAATIKVSEQEKDIDREFGVI